MSVAIVVLLALFVFGSTAVKSSFGRSRLLMRKLTGAKPALHASGTTVKLPKRGSISRPPPPPPPPPSPPPPPPPCARGSLLSAPSCFQPPRFQCASGGICGCIYTI